MSIVGAVADDLTGATDLAGAMVERGVRTTLMLGVPTRTAPAGGAVVVALKTRSLDPATARQLTRAAADWLTGQGAGVVYDKYCSTFDSTPAGNIGPIADELAGPGARRPVVVHCPAYPANGRTVHQGHLFVRAALLSESPMRAHPLTPMTDANLLRVLGAQTDRAVALLPAQVVRAGAGAVRVRLDELIGDGTGHVIADATTDADLDVLAEGIADLVAAGRVVPAGGAPFGAAVAVRLTDGTDPAGAHPPTSPIGRCAVVAGSASTATQEQIEAYAAGHPVLRLAAEDAAADVDAAVDAALGWAAAQPADAALLIAADARPAAVERARAAVGGDRAAAALERALGMIAARLVDELGVRRLVVAGGETSGAVAAALGVHALHVGPAIAPGVPWTFTTGGPPHMALAFKSGNFGGRDFFTDAFARLDGEPA